MKMHFQISLATIQNAGRILVLKEGKIVEQGSHTDLLKLGEVYHKLWLLQVETGADRVKR